MLLYFFLILSFLLVCIFSPPPSRPDSEISLPFPSFERCSPGLLHVLLIRTPEASSSDTYLEKQI